MQPKAPLFTTAALVFLGLLISIPSAGQQIRFPDFSSLNNMRLNGSTHGAVWQQNHVLRLTDGPLSPFARNPQQATAYFTGKQPVVSGFTSWFEFQIHNPAICCNPGDGIAFIIQNSTATDPSYGASGAGLTALGAFNGGIGYAGINNNLAIEFDIQANPWDPNNNHVSVQSCGPATNTPVHLPGAYTIGNNHNVTSCLLSQNAINTSVPLIGDNCSSGRCQDGAVHQAVVEYTPPAPNQNTGTLQIWLDPTFIPGTHTPAPNSPPIIAVPYNVTFSNSNPTGLNLDAGKAWVGFTASQPIMSTAQDVLAWEFTPHTPLQITQTIPPGGQENDFIFGGYIFAATYPNGFTNPDGIQMTVLSTPTNRNVFFTQRLLGTQFANEACVVNLETGGNCIVYSVTCQLPNGQPIVCPSEPDPTIAMCTQFYTADPITANNADYLKADPIGSNNWASIFTGFQQNLIDPIVTGKGTNFSDFVATFRRNGMSMNSEGVGASAVMPQVPNSPGSGGICPPVQ
jgi:legume-like lectin family protein